MIEIQIKQATKDGFAKMQIGEVADLSYVESGTRRGRVQGGGMISPALTCNSECIHRIELNDDMETLKIMQYRIRRLTERECLRLMDVSESDIDKIAEVNSVTQMYKQAGNSIVVGVMCAMFRQLNIKGVEQWN